MQILIASPEQNLMTFYKLNKLPANSYVPRMTKNTENITSLCNSYYVAYEYTQNEYYVVKLAEKCVCLCVGGVVCGTDCRTADDRNCVQQASITSFAKKCAQCCKCVQNNLFSPNINTIVQF